MRSLFVAVLLVGSAVYGSGCSCNGDDAPAHPDGGMQPDAGPEETVCEELAPLPSGTCEVTSLGAAKIIKGNILTPQTIFRGGQVAISAEGKITCAGCNCAQGGETVISCPGATVSPGLINTHDHITFTQMSPYSDSGERYDDRQQWRIGGSSFEGHTKIPSTGGANADKVSYGELRFLMGGATSIVGSGGSAGLLRNLDQASHLEGLLNPQGTAHKAVDFETFPLGDTSGTRHDGDCNYPSNITPTTVASYDSYEPHTAEGIDKWAHNEFKCQSSDTFDSTAPGISQNLLLPKTAMIHAIGLTAGDYGSMAQNGTALIWSPRSNVTLYGDTARVTTAARQGVEIALGTDWTASGSINMLRELRCADSLNKTYMDSYFSDKQLWHMVTLNAAAVTATDDQIGMLAPDHVADISIFRANDRAPYRAIIDADPQDVALVMRAGKVLYGDDAAVSNLASDCDTIDVCGTMKRVCLKSEINKTLMELQVAVGTIYPAFACSTPQNEPSCTPKRPTSVSGSTVYTGEVSATDSDGDGIPDTSDNCPKVFNPVRPMDLGVQADADSDGQGDSCDVCPTDANVTTCTQVDPNDRDHDGVTNTADNCPDVANPGQTDGDGDGHGDACDACPSAANPGSAGCPASIYAVKMGMVPDGSPVRITNALVTGKGANGFFVQTKVGDAGYMTADYSGLFVYTGANAPTLTTAVVGLRVTIDGNVATFQGQKELDTLSSVTATTMMAEAAPAAVSATYAEIKTGGTRAAALESVLVSVPSATVSAADATVGEFTLTSGADSLVIDDFLYLSTPLPAVNAAYNQVTGILAMRQSASKLEPRAASDFALGPPGLASFGPAMTYTRVGSTGAMTIPSSAALTVTLGSPAQGDTDVTITSSDPTALTVVGGKVTVANGATSATVLVDGLTQSADVTLTATLGTTQTAHVRVLGATEVPTTVTLSPSTASITAGGTAAITATLDIPAPSGGTTIAIAVAPMDAGVLSATTVTVPADTRSASFTFIDSQMYMTSTVTGTLGSSTSSTVITATTSMGHLVISQVYGGGGNSMATYANDFIELFNASGAAIGLQGKSVQYASAAGTSWQTLALPNITLAPGGYALVQLATGGAVGLTLPTPDAMANINMSASAGKVALVNATTALTGGCPPTTNIIDFVGFGTTANCTEMMMGPAPAGSNTTSVIRGTGGCTDTDNNTSNFAAGTPMPRNSAATLAPCP